MRRVVVLVLLAVAATTGAFAEVTRTLRVELAGNPASSFGVENLAGVMRVTAGDGNTVVAVATVHAESAALAAAVRLEQVTGNGGEPVLRLPSSSRHLDIPLPAGRRARRSSTTAAGSG